MNWWGTACLCDLHRIKQTKTNHVSEQVVKHQFEVKGAQRITQMSLKLAEPEFSPFFHIARPVLSGSVFAVPFAAISDKHRPK